jgi:hypothetical protein
MQREEYVCVVCFHVWKVRAVAASERQCSICKRRIAVPFPRFEKAVLDAKEWIDKHLSPLPIAPLYFPQAISSALEVVGDLPPQFPWGIGTLRRILDVALRWKPDKEDLRECLRRLKSEGVI